jgi:putative transposase
LSSIPKVLYWWLAYEPPMFRPTMAGPTLRQVRRMLPKRTISFADRVYRGPKLLAAQVDFGHWTIKISPDRRPSATSRLSLGVGSCRTNLWLAWPQPPPRQGLRNGNPSDEAWFMIASVQLRPRHFAGGLDICLSLRANLRTFCHSGLMFQSKALFSERLNLFR